MPTELLVPDSIDQTFSKDVTDDLNAWINAPRAPRTYLRLREGKRYMVNGTLALNATQFLTLDYNGATQVVTTDGTTLADGTPNDPKKARTRTHLLLDGVLATKVDRVNIEGPHPDGGTHLSAEVRPLEAQHGIEVRGGAYVAIERANVQNVFGDFLYIAGTKTAPPYLVRVNDFVGNRNGRQGITVARGQDINITGFDIRNIRHSAFDIETAWDDWHVEDVKISNGTVGPKRLNLIAAWGKGTTRNITFDTIAVEDAIADADIGNADITTRQHSEWVITNIRSDRVNYGTDRGSVMVLRRVDGALVCHNTQPKSQARITRFVDFRDCTRALASHNVIH